MLTVKRPNGTIVDYRLAENDSDHTLRLEEVVVEDGENFTSFRATSQNPEIAGVVERARPDVAKYLGSIVAQKAAQYQTVQVMQNGDRQ